MLEIQNLKVKYGEVVALNGVSLTINQGELVALIGSNGAGKTTLMNTISGLLQPAQGEINFLNQSLLRTAAHNIVERGIAHVPEGRKVFASMSVKDNLTLGAYLRLKKGDAKAVANDLEQIYATFPRLKERETQQAGTLSGGEQQMLALGRALMSKPKLLLLDEPSMGLAPVIIDEVFKLIKSLKKSGEMTIFLVEQLAFRALNVADRAYVIEQGKIRLSGDARDLIGNEEVKKAYL